VRLTRPLATVAAPAPAPAPAAHPVAAAFAASVDSLRRAQEDVLARFAAPARPRLGPREARVVRRLSVDAFPELADHTFFRQPPGWPVMSDRHPVVPMTMTIALMMDAAAALVPERTPIAVEDVRAFRWIAVGAPVDAELTLRFDGKDRVAVSVAGFAEGTVVVGEAYPEPPPPAAFALAGERPAPHDAARLYRDRWMFHGPAYQGVVDLGPMGDDGIRGVLEAGAAKGALLDNAGQLFGYWIMVTNVRDRMAMPVRIRRMRFFGPHPEPGARVGCRVAIRRHAEREVTADLEITRDGRVWAAIDEWEDRRFDTDDRFWDILQYPERHLLGEARPDGFVLFRDGYRAAPTREQLCRRYLGERERATYDAHGPRGQRAWLSARVAGKDAVRAHLWRGGVRDIFPVEVELASDPSGRPRVVAPAGRDLRISLAHKDDVAVALVAEGRDVGIDVERVEPRAPAFIESAFFPDEVAMAARGEDRDEWLTRLWVAKEAVGKARGTGLQGNPRRLRATDRTGERILVEGLWVETRRDGDHVIGWSYA
jgi:phosphopantetheinyl transferase (holo-ACP synthase)